MLVLQGVSKDASLGWSKKLLQLLFTFHLLLYLLLKPPFLFLLFVCFIRYVIYLVHYSSGIHNMLYIFNIYNIWIIYAHYKTNIYIWCTLIKK